MYLKSLEIHGFKSFANRVKLEFDRGVTAVVGPNGSGKSNISDAIRWVLGEQSVKALRGSKMEDVIFTGTEHRKPLGYAEVSLIIDNSERQLDIDYAEVVITRRLYRSGESEYLINKTLCRLKDISELLMDTGIGKDGYSLIGQGKVAEILGSKSEDRRIIFEEAAGITKYKTKKIEAERKLDNTKLNLVRIGDLILEIGSRLEPLSMQSVKAKSYLRLKDELKELEIKLFADNINKSLDKLKDADSDYQKVKNNINQENTKFDNITKENQQRSERLKVLEETSDNARSNLFLLETDIEKLNAEIVLNEEKAKNFLDNANRLKEEENESIARLNTYEQQIAGKENLKNSLKEQLAASTIRMNELKREMDEMIALLDKDEQNIEALNEKVMAAIDISTDKKNQINSLTNFIEGIIRQKSMLDDEIVRLKNEIEKESLTKKDLEEELQKNAVVLNKLKDDKLKYQEQRKKLLAVAEFINKNLNQIKSEYTYKSSKLKMLNDMERNLEGYNRSVKAVLSIAESYSGICGALVQLIKTDSKYEIAIEAALGGNLQNIVTKTEEDAKKAIEHLKKTGAGRATFMPVTSVRGNKFDNSRIHDISVSKGFIGVASDLLEYDKYYEGIIRFLLGRVIVVDTMENAIAMARKFKYSFRIATLSGEIFNTGGTISGGSGPHAQEGGISSLLGRRREAEELNNDLVTLKGSQEKIENDLIQNRTELSENAELIDKINVSIGEHDIAQIRDERHIEQIDDNIKNYIARISMLEAENSQLSRQREDSLHEKDKIISELNFTERDIAKNKEEIVNYQNKYKEGREARDALHGKITDYRIAVNSLSENISTVEGEINDICNSKSEINKLILNRVSEREHFVQNAKSMEEKNLIIKENIRILKEKISGAGMELEGLMSEKQALDEEMSGMIGTMAEVNRSISMLSEDLNRIEGRRSRLIADADQLRSRLWEEYEITYSEAVGFTSSKSTGELSLAQIQKKVEHLKVEIKNLGSVNVNAIEEYETLKSRYDFMVSQQEDMVEAEKKLRDIISEMQQVMKTQFLEHFKVININFNIVFRELFDGGNAYLSLEDEDNVLECGIEITAQPPGKKLQSMSLFSGGEKSLIAIALLFATIRMHPVPFCILDEIEAALDEANLSRFTKYINKYKNSTQFILVTHRKTTMEAADVLYGVTMQERGISKIVSMKL